MVFAQEDVRRRNTSNLHSDAQRLQRPSRRERSEALDPHEAQKKHL